MFYDKVETQDPKTFKCVCKCCKDANVRPPKTYTCRVGSGTGTLTRHLKSSHGLTSESTQTPLGSSQTQIHGYASSLPGTGMPFQYNKERMINEFGRFVIAKELPFNFGESPDFERFSRLALQPAFRPVPRNTLKRSTFRSFAQAKQQLIQSFLVFDGRVSLTTDTWTSTTDEPYMCVTAHWIDHDWLLQKRIIAFEIMEESHNGLHIKNRLIDVMYRFNLLDKVFSISVDNATANTKAIEYLRNEPSFKLLLGGSMLHIRCCAHIVNLSVQEGIKEMRPLLNPIRQVIKHFRKGGVKRKYKQLCRQAGMRPKVWSLDTPTRWNSTYYLLKDAIRYKAILTTMYNDDCTDPQHLLLDYHWQVAEQLESVLETYDNATKVFSYQYEPNIHQVIISCVDIIHSIKINFDFDAIRGALQCMKDKWCSYFEEFPYIYGIAVLLDPALKLDGLRDLLEYYYDCLGITFDVDYYVQQCKYILEQLYDTYISNNAGNEFQSSRLESSRFNSVINNIIKKQKSTSHQGVGEYLSYKHETGGGDFDIIRWWNNKQSEFPVLARIAKDILAIPASTIASESAFSAGRRVLDEKRSRLAPDSIEVCVCKKDWDQAETRTQGLKDNEEEEDDPWMMFDTSSAGSSTAAEDFATLDEQED